eukprot:4843249-Heterocapsa_arctica.AAC.1
MSTVWKGSGFTMYIFFVEDITIQESLINTLRMDIKNVRSKRWRHWVDNSWGHKKHIFTDGPGESKAMGD